MTCVALARVRIKARFSSSDSADRTVLGSLRNRVNWGCTSELPKAVISRRAVLSTLRGDSQINQLSTCFGYYLRIIFNACERVLPEVQLVLVGLRHGGQTVQMTQELDSVVRLDVVHPVAEHLQ